MISAWFGPAGAQYSAQYYQLYAPIYKGGSNRGSSFGKNTVGAAERYLPQNINGR